MFRVKYSNVCLFGALGTFAIISKIIFDKIYLTSKIIVDEEFHLPLGEAYCKYEFDKVIASLWHPKVTTFPGLYLVSSLLLGTVNLCSVYWLRLISLLFSFINILLFYCLQNMNNEPSWKNIFSAINLGLLPPLYFFSHLYYTDVASLTMILLLFILSQRGNHYLASIFGICAVLFRQTNIIWVGMVFGSFILKELNAINQKKPRRVSQGVTFKEALQFFKGDLWITLRRASLNFWLNATSYGSLLIFFLVFVYLNGSIVVVASSLVIIHFNTLVHPYMLADNRHYVFYIWNRFYGKYFLFRYLMVPIYLFSLFVIISKLWNKRDVTFLLFFIPCTSIVLITQRLLEFRYFFVPYVLFRTQLTNITLQSLLYEFLTYLLLNICTFYLFFTKTIEWDDFDYPQRLIW
ncbi:Dol-P-Glc:Glc(2)Man(9)GlcNAc(2)-PP-Dol alpha-1,2-glucosyltransferase [Asbolus verrucosus]|uniref:Dol-P-Glc:Glc(2)Man(9)GlcNAc(2)-PP-Dol alpha-1,2-glucosyltransferase n=1 Tax=Asbolus verrucosus TaxID=1661398 RepID=A0A482VCM5_ASBVE|nr:Dol-P-Glc:Glc(2)Man(9)GlcNAc(2)-PP-Dol alpha-1,2-glucosyltransferase [Asbolus verrucosus]